MVEPLIQHVSDTAFLVAEARARESERPEALFRDPLARRLSGDKGQAIAASFHPMTAWTVVMRTLVIDAFVQQAVAAGFRTIVNLGAGLDTRPYRMDLPAQLHWIEVDYPDVVAYKERLLANETQHCRLTREGLDLSITEQRRALLARVAAASPRILVLTEGVIPYLTEDQVGALADDLNATPHVTGWILDYVSPESHAYRDRQVGNRLARAPFKFRPEDWYAFFAQHGWRVRDLHYLADESQRVGRRPPLPLMARLIMKTLGRFAPPERRDAFRKFIGFAWMEKGGAPTRP
jgi:methyltransferase (TIGR00027 family)